MKIHQIWYRWNKQVYRFLFEMTAIICGITISFWLNDYQQDIDKENRETQLLKDLLIEIDQIEEYNEWRQSTYEVDNYWMDYVSDNWDSLDVEFVAAELSELKYNASFHHLFFEHREFHPPVSLLISLRPEESAHTITIPKIKKQINTLNMFRGFLKLNIESEIDLQLRFRERVMLDSSLTMSKVIKTSVKTFHQQFNPESYDKEKTAQQLRTITTKPYARNYLNLKIRQRAFIMSFVKRYRENLIELRKLIEEELSHRK